VREGALEALLAVMRLPVDTERTYSTIKLNKEARARRTAATPEGCLGFRVALPAAALLLTADAPVVALARCWQHRRAPRSLC
jgi:hypothetical protein